MNNSMSLAIFTLVVAVMAMALGAIANERIDKLERTTVQVEEVPHG